MQDHRLLTEEMNQNENKRLVSPAPNCQAKVSPNRGWWGAPWTPQIDKRETAHPIYAKMTAVANASAKMIGSTAKTHAAAQAGEQASHSLFKEE